MKRGMKMLNRIQLIGRLGADPEEKVTTNGYKYSRFSIPLFHGFQKQTRKTSWITCEGWNKLGEMIQKHCKKGMLVYIEGEMTIDNWESNGERRSRPYIRLNEVRFLDKNGGQASGWEEQPKKQEKKQSQPQESDVFDSLDEEGDLDEIFKEFDFVE
jgi:single-strand DNA-binding protein